MLPLKRALVLGCVFVLTAAGAVLATHNSPIGLSSEPVGRATWDRGERTQFLSALAKQGPLATSDVFVVKATLAASGRTDWHIHTGPSVVLVTAGELRVFEATANGGCRETDYTAGDAFFHTPEQHNFTNLGGSPATFVITYFIPVGAVPLPHDPISPPTC